MHFMRRKHPSDQSWSSTDILSRQIRLGVIHHVSLTNCNIIRRYYQSLKVLSDCNISSSVITCIKEVSPKVYPNIIPMYDEENTNHVLYGNHFELSILKFSTQ